MDKVICFSVLERVADWSENSCPNESRTSFPNESRTSCMYSHELQDTATFLSALGKFMLEQYKSLSDFTFAKVMSTDKFWEQELYTNTLFKFVGCCKRRIGLNARCSVLQCDAVCCSVLQSVAVCCSVLQCVAVCCSVLQCVAVCCSVLQRVNIGSD